MASIVNYFEIGSPDPERAQAFYGSLFDWTFGESSPASYQMLNGDKGGLWDTSSLEGTSWAIFYVQVDDVKAAIARAEALGASVAIPFVDNGAIEFAHLLDPQGNRFGVWHPKQQG
ncbi:VOC family protein [Arthrobacter sp. 2MCAF14]|uniref:VOC family protein n=1 Tax=Arthrobacter sp. 2MCAF14 TaxID=3232982 RepID=UPI003F8E2FE7